MGTVWSTAFPFPLIKPSSNNESLSTIQKTDYRNYIDQAVWNNFRN